MRILHAASSYPRWPGDGTAPFMEEMLQAMGGRGHDVSIVVPRIDGLEEGERQGVRVVGALYAPQKAQIWGYGRSLSSRGSVSLAATLLTPLAITSMAQQLRKERRRMRPDIIHLHWTLPSGILSLLVPPETPVVISIHGADARAIQGHLRPIARRILRRADALIAASSKILETVERVLPDARTKSFVIPHGANADLFDNKDKLHARRSLGLEPTSPVVLAVGRLVKKKGFENLIQSIGLVEARTANLYVIGDGPERTRLIAAIPPGCQDRVHLLGQQTRPEVARWLGAADVVAIPSLDIQGDVDSGPVVLMEALAAGRPVVASRVGMAPDVIEHGVNGLLLDSTTPERIAAGLDSTIKASGPMGLRAHETFRRVGNWDRVAKDLEDLYKKLMADWR